MHLATMALSLFARPSSHSRTAIVLILPLPLVPCVRRSRTNQLPRYYLAPGKPRINPAPIHIPCKKPSLLGLCHSRADIATVSRS